MKIVMQAIVILMAMSFSIVLNMLIVPKLLSLIDEVIK